MDGPQTSIWLRFKPRYLLVVNISVFGKTADKKLTTNLCRFYNIENPTEEKVKEVKALLTNECFTDKYIPR